MTVYKGYDDALRRGGRDVWPGCGNGRCRPCGQIHDFSYWVGNKVVHSIQCLLNSQAGCPDPKPGGCQLKSVKHRTCSACGKPVIGDEERSAAVRRYEAWKKVAEVLRDAVEDVRPSFLII